MVDLVDMVDMNQYMFRAYPTPHHIRDYGTVHRNTVTDWGQMTDISLDESRSLIDEYVATPNRSKRMLSAHDARKIIQATTDEILSSEIIDRLNNNNMTYVVTLVYRSLRDNVRPTIPNQQMEQLILGTMDKLIMYYHQSIYIRERLHRCLTEDAMLRFIQRLLADPIPVDIAPMKRTTEVGCFEWIRNLFR